MHYLRLFVGAMLLAALAVVGIGCSGTPVPPPPLPTVYDQVLLVGWDGVQRERLHELLAAKKLPNLAAMLTRGALLDVNITQGATDTKCGWAQILTGYRPEITHIYSNSRFSVLPDGLSVFERLEAAFGDDQVYTGAVISKSNHMDVAPAGAIYSNLQYKPDVFVNALETRDRVRARALAEIALHWQERAFLFVHYQEVDVAGHNRGENSVPYETAIIGLDEELGALVAQLRAQKQYDSTLILVTADHGFDEGLHTHLDAPRIFLATNNPDFTGPADRLDMTPTVLQRMGVDPATVTPAMDGTAR